MRALPLLLLVACDAANPRMLNSEGAETSPAETSPAPGTTGWVLTYNETYVVETYGPGPPPADCPAPTSSKAMRPGAHNSISLSRSLSLSTWAASIPSLMRESRHTSPSLPVCSSRELR